MGVFLQVGHNSENLLAEEGLRDLSGAVLSPVNYDQIKTDAQIKSLKTQGRVSVFDPQLYIPKSGRDNLTKWNYFPKEIDTADLTALNWWTSKVNAPLSETMKALQPNKVCSPVQVPRTYSESYFELMVQVCESLQSELKGSSVEVIQTVIVNMQDLNSLERVMRVASIISKTSAEMVYLVFMSDKEPRLEFADMDPLKYSMRLISEVKRADLKVFVAFSSSDSVLWKAAGAEHVATGKFFNLRRFTQSRFEEPGGGGGGQLPYFFEESLMTFLRESDVKRLAKHGIQSDSNSRNPYVAEIQKQLAEKPGVAWLALAWKQYLWWAVDEEKRVQNNGDAGKILSIADENWKQLLEKPFLMEEMKNDGKWVRLWRIALGEYLE